MSAAAASAVDPDRFVIPTRSKVVKMINPSTIQKNLWGDVKHWIPSYRCQSCNIVMSKKIATLTPQKIYVCGHITCAHCIVESYLIDQNPVCPVKGCGCWVNPYDKKAERDGI